MPMAPISGAVPPQHGVQQLQQRLHRMGFYHGTLDGDFGPLTKSALHEFQTVAGAIASPDGSDDQTAHPAQPAKSAGEP